MIQAKKKVMIKELNTKIKNWHMYSDIMYGYSKKEALMFLKRFQVGVYDAILKESFWFAPSINIDILVNWEIDRKKESSFAIISEENFIVYSILLSIKDHITKINSYPKVYNMFYHTKINNYSQQPMTKENTREFQKLYTKILNQNYTWREAYSITTNYNKFNITENKNFPNNIIELQSIFTPQISTYYQKLFTKDIHLLDILPIDKKIKNLLNNLTKNKIKDYINTKKPSSHDKYIIQTLQNVNSTDLERTTKLLNSLIVPKKVNDLSPLPKDIDPTDIQKHYNFIYKHTTELEYVEEAINILNNLIAKLPRSEETKFNLILIFNTILTSRKIVPPLLTKEIINLTDKERIEKILTETINLSKNKEA